MKTTATNRQTMNESRQQFREFHELLQRGRFRARLWRDPKALNCCYLEPFTFLLTVGLESWARYFRSAVNETARLTARARSGAGPRPQ
jgi:hypothetical protein